MVNTIALGVKKLEVLVQLHAQNLIYFDARWDVDCLKFRKELSVLLSRKSDNGILFHCDLDVDSEAEEYVIDGLHITKLPVLVYYQGSTDPLRIVSDRNEILQCIHTTNFLADINVYNPGLCKQISDKQFIQNVLFASDGGIGVLFVAGDKSSVGKTTTCLCILASLLTLGVSSDDIAYIKPVTQCEAEQPIARFCRRMGVTCEPIGPVVFYKGFTRAFLAKETETSQELLDKSAAAVKSIGRNKKFVLIDGVGYPSVG